MIIESELFTEKIYQIQAGVKNEAWAFGPQPRLIPPLQLRVRMLLIKNGPEFERTKNSQAQEPS